ncbi:MAG: LysR substrate-binding domain-containing protein [Shewanella sp.]|nr:LysR substrate-binding domain-containing protein [Shewanella sp.]MCF1430785.1 LysR substrate-binding domain-containing protein [Shewanella sp.]MCF1458564.1 LysR substrate-binding domain-containing protein [Shewanella sp.]
MPAASQVQMFSQVLMSVEDAAAGLGIALATDFMVQGDLSSGSLIALDWPDLHTCFQFNLCCKQRKWKSRTLRSLSIG